MSVNEEFLDDLLVKYRIRSNMAYSEAEDGVYTIDEYQEAQKKINGEFSEAILQHFQQEQESKVVMKGTPFQSIDPKTYDWKGMKNPLAKAKEGYCHCTTDKKNYNTKPIQVTGKPKKFLKRTGTDVKFAEPEKTYTQSEVDRLIKEARIEELVSIEAWVGDVSVKTFAGGDIETIEERLKTLKNKDTQKSG